jgi:hypothetical protein
MERPEPWGPPPAFPVPWRQVSIAPDVFMWAREGDPVLHPFPPDGTLWSVLVFADGTMVRPDDIPPPGIPRLD